ncbi:MAG: tetratricopeptide repeat protein [Myxococcota bacterium]
MGRLIVGPRSVPGLIAVVLCASCTASPQPPDPDRARLLAEAELAAGRPEEAAARFQAVIDGMPDDARALDGLARAQLAAGRPEEALVALDRLDDLATPPPNEADRVHCAVWLSVASRRAEADRLDEALELAARRDAGGCRVEQTERVRGHAYQVRAAAARSRGEPESALRAYGSAAAALLADAPVEIYRAGGEILLAGGRYDEAVEWLGRGLEIHPRDRRLLSLMVEALSGGVGPHP